MEQVTCVVVCRGSDRNFRDGSESNDKVDVFRVIRRIVDEIVEDFLRPHAVGYDSHILDFGVFLYMLDKRWNVVHCDISQGCMVPVCEICVWIQNSVLSAVFIASSVGQPDIVSCIT
jgi:hypothetical protein